LSLYSYAIVFLLSYPVSRAQRVRTAIAQAPEKSDRAIAAELGVTHDTVAKHRRTTVEVSTVERRVGRDGKARRLPPGFRPGRQTPRRTYRRLPNRFFGGGTRL